MKPWRFCRKSGRRRKKSRRRSDIGICEETGSHAPTGTTDLAQRRKDARSSQLCICLHYHIAPRSDKTRATFKWEYIDLDEGINPILCKPIRTESAAVSFIEPRFLPVFKNYKRLAWRKKATTRRTSVPASSNAGHSGTTKEIKRPHISSDKTVNEWLSKGPKRC